MRLTMVALPEEMNKDHLTTVRFHYHEDSNLTSETCYREQKVVFTAVFDSAGHLFHILVWRG